MEKTVITRPLGILMLFYATLIAKDVLASSGDDKHLPLVDTTRKVTFYKFVGDAERDASTQQGPEGIALGHSVKIPQETDAALQKELESYLDGKKRYHSFKSRLWKATSYLLEGIRHLTFAAALVVLTDDIASSAIPLKRNPTFYGTVFLGTSWLASYLWTKAEAKSYTREKQLFTLIRSTRRKIYNTFDSSTPPVHTASSCQNGQQAIPAVDNLALNVPLCSQLGDSSPAQPAKTDSGEQITPQNIEDRKKTPSKKRGEFDVIQFSEENALLTENQLGTYLRDSASHYAASCRRWQLAADMFSFTAFTSLYGGIGTISLNLILNSRCILMGSNFYGLTLVGGSLAWGYLAKKAANAAQANEIKASDTDLENQLSRLVK